MPRLCSVCTHEKRREIDSAILSGNESLRGIARRYGLSPDAVERHTSDHITDAIKQSAEAQKGIDVSRQLMMLNTVTLAILSEARTTKDSDIALKAIDRVTKQLELQAKLIGDIGGKQQSIWTSDEWKLIRETLLQVLLPFADARLAVASALIALEAKHAGID